MTREDILNKAKECVCQSRQADYGDIENNFYTIALMWSSYINIVFEKRIIQSESDDDFYVNITPEDVAAMMILLKVARIASGHQKADNWIDIAGYAACGGELEKS